MSDTNGQPAPGPAAIAVPDDLADLAESPLWRGLPITKTSEAILVEILTEQKRTNEKLDGFLAALDQLGESFGPIANMFGGGK